MEVTLRAFWGMHRMTRLCNITREQVNFPADPCALFTMEQASAFLACSRGTIYNLMKQQLLHPVKVLGSTRFRRSDLEAFVSKAAHDTI